MSMIKRLEKLPIANVRIRNCRKMLTLPIVRVHVANITFSCEYLADRSSPDPVRRNRIATLELGFQLPGVH